MARWTVDIIIPTYKPGRDFLNLIESLNMQTVRPGRIIVINTEEKYLSNLIYGTDFREKNKNVYITNISRKEFDHAKTRSMGAAKSDADYVMFMTQDAMPKNNNLIEELFAFMEDEKVAVSYARQLPEFDSSYIERYSRYFNYPDVDRVKSLDDIEELGIKTYFCSDVCALYRRSVFDALGGFEGYAIFNEDMVYAAKAVKAGYKIAYASKACVYHSHDYSGKQQFKRNFDLGVSQANHPEIFENIKSEGEGIRLVKNTAAYLLKKRQPLLILRLAYLSGCKLIGYKLGKGYKKLSKRRILKYTSNKEYWYRFWDKSNISVDVYSGYGKNEEGL